MESPYKFSVQRQPQDKLLAHKPYSYDHENYGIYTKRVKEARDAAKKEKHGLLTTTSETTRMKVAPPKRPAKNVCSRRIEALARPKPSVVQYNYMKYKDLLPPEKIDRVFSHH